MRTRLASFVILTLLSVCAPASADDFRFALLTDIHIGSGANAYVDLQRSVDEINRTPCIDFVIVAGDIAENGNNAAIDTMRHELERLNVKYYSTPGNHDTKWSESGATHFGDVFGADKFEFEHGGILFLGFNTGPLIRMADGHVLPEDIAWLKTELQKAGHEKPVILVTHYPVREGDVDNWYELTDAVRDYNIRAFLGGHYHRNMFLAYDGMPGIVCRSNLRGGDSVGGYTLFEVKGDSLTAYEQKIGGKPAKWASVALKGDYQRTLMPRPDFSVNHEYSQVKPRWTLQTGVGIYASPVVYKNKIYVADGQGCLTCYDMKGKELWRVRTGNRIFGTPDIADGTVVFGSADKNIYGIDADTGRQIWKVAATEPVIGAATIEKGIAYIGASDHTFRAIDIKSGKIRWTYSGIRGFIEAKPLVTKNHVVFGAWDNTLYALSKTTGQEQWRWTGGLTRMHFSPAAVWPVSAGGKVFIVDPKRATTAIDEQTGATVWRTYESQVRETIGISKDKKRIYAKTMNDTIVCFSTQGDKPVKLWACNVGYGYEFAPSMIAEKDNVVFGSTKNGLVFAIEAKTGRLMWKHKVSNSLVNTVVPLSGRSLLFTAASGELGILEAEKEQ